MKKILVIFISFIILIIGCLFILGNKEEQHVEEQFGV